MEEVILDTPFDLARQARLYCLSDFPSWAEHPMRAVRSVAHQVCGFVERSSVLDETGALSGGAMVLTTSKATSAAISEAAAPRLAGLGIGLKTTEILGNARAVTQFANEGGVLVGTRGLWQGVDVRDPRRLRLVWINKLPFAPFANPLIVARRARAVEQAKLAGDVDPERSADENYYLPLAALAVRQAVGRLIRSVDHRGIVVISDAKLAGNDPRRRLYRRTFLGSLEPGLRRDVGNDVGAGNVMTMAEAWRDALTFGVAEGFVNGERAVEIQDDEAMARFVDLPEMTAVRGQLLDKDEAAILRSRGSQAFVDEVLDRCQNLARILGGDDHVLHPEQCEAIATVARGDDLLALLPTGFGKSYCYQLPGLVLPGVTLVVSPLVSLMVDQAMGLGSIVGPMVRALTGPMRESNSRMGKSQIAETLRGEVDHGIRLIYLSPERLADARFRALVREGVVAESWLASPSTKLIVSLTGVTISVQVIDVSIGSSHDSRKSSPHFRSVPLRPLQMRRCDLACEVDSSRYCQSAYPTVTALTSLWLRRTQCGPSFCNLAPASRTPEWRTERGRWVDRGCGRGPEPPCDLLLPHRARGRGAHGIIAGVPGRSAGR